MGVPSFYRWLTTKYPEIVVKAKQNKDNNTSPNPNGFEFDHLYLDMNGIIHPCFHPEDNDSVLQPSCFEDVFNNVFEYIDHLFSIVRPRKLLYMAIDGVAPRAKLNQQRSRRFQTAKNIKLTEIEEERLRREFELQGKPVLPKHQSEVSDPNIITPGTEFMFLLSEKLRFYVESRMNTDPGWRGLQVIISDSNVPGEGEHKIMSFIRNQRRLPGYNPNTRHCLYGLDADLIMLGLATHEIHFSIIREDVLQLEQQPTRELSRHIVESSSGTSTSRGWFKDPNPGPAKLNDQCSNEPSKRNARPYQFLHVWILREYLEIDMKKMIIDVPNDFVFDVERVIDDFVFMCLFVGNDFLPHMPSLEINEGAIDLMMSVYTKNMKKIGGYLVNMERVREKHDAYIKLTRVEKFITLVGEYEEKIFKKRSGIMASKLRRLLKNIDAEDEGYNIEAESNEFDSVQSSESSIDLQVEIVRNTKELKEKLKLELRKKSDVFKNGTYETDKVNLGSVGWKERYYKLKFCVEGRNDMELMRKELVQKYTEGLMWVLQYYFVGVPSWTWYYPYDYGPFASDLKGISKVRSHFEKSSPFSPFQQLMAVLPPSSAHALPVAYRPLMTEESSSIIDFYPHDFEVDMDGKRFSWQGKCKLPIIDERRLLTATRFLETDLTVEEKRRNKIGVDKLIVTKGGTFGLKISLGIENMRSKTLNEAIITLDISGQIGGRICLCDENRPIDVGGRNDVVCVLYKLPSEEVSHIPRPIAGSSYPDKKITACDVEDTLLWHEQWGSNPARRLLSRDNRNRTKFSPKTDPDFIHKGAGSGWLGRGSVLGSDPDSVCEQRRVFEHSREMTGIDDLTISDTNPSSEPYNRYQPPRSRGSNQRFGGRSWSSTDNWNFDSQSSGSRTSRSSRSSNPGQSNLNRWGSDDPGDNSRW